MFEHQDDLAKIDESIPLSRKLELLHRRLKAKFPFISRIAAATFDAKTALVKTFVYASSEDQPLVHYQAKLDEASSLLEIVRQRRPRVVNDLSIFDRGEHDHTQKIKAQGHLASYTMPMYSRGELFGFIFFNSTERESFTEEVLGQIDPYGHLISLMIINDLAMTQNLLAAVKASRSMAHLRDDETGSHQDRMSRYARLIARKVAENNGLTDEDVEAVFLFSPLHDIGKIGIPDNILLKPGRLTEAEFAQMKVHTLMGRKLIDQLLEDFDLTRMQNVDILRNIAELHHESIDGSGYPHGASGKDIPIEARIVTVADVFDALTSHRPYKSAWSNDVAFKMLRDFSGIKFDPECVEALLSSRDEIEQIQAMFAENELG